LASVSLKLLSTIALRMHNITEEFVFLRLKVASASVSLFYLLTRLLGCVDGQHLLCAVLRLPKTHDIQSVFNNVACLLVEP
jgi:hypothetical protein